MHTAYLGLGANLGNRRETLDQACQMIGKLIGDIVRQSAYYETAPWSFESEHLFLNAVVCVHTSLTPRQLLKAAQRIERNLGKRRQHATERTADTIYHDRPIDIDILLYDDINIDTPDLIIPHPRMASRPFVMDPLREIMDATAFEHLLERLQCDD